MKLSARTQADEPLRYSPKFQRAGRVAGERRQAFFRQHLTQKEYLRLKHLEFVLLVSHPPDCCRDHQEGVLLQLGNVWSERKCALLGIP